MRPNHETPIRTVPISEPPWSLGRHICSYRAEQQRTQQPTAFTPDLDVVMAGHRMPAPINV